MIVHHHSEENSATHRAAASDLTTNYCNAKDRLGSILTLLILPHQETIDAENVLNKSEGAPLEKTYLAADAAVCKCHDESLQAKCINLIR